MYSVDVRDTAKSGIGHIDNRHLNDLVESISMNVGGSCRNAKVSSPPMIGVSVGGVIVVGVRESRIHGEGHQEFDNPWYPLAASIENGRQNGRTIGCERERDDNAESNLGSGMPNSGEPDALKGARPVRRGECGNVQ